MGNIFEEKEEYLTPCQAIRLKCLECVGWETMEISRCTSRSCPLYPYRMNHRAPAGKRIGLKKGKELMQQALS